ncbi:MAG TPA: hypothetical protein DIS66_01140 [Candidatus Omnitrophica bacterium]|nr:hypothetical protein [Candidatus Omnitrophota bacterium]
MKPFLNTDTESRIQLPLKVAGLILVYILLWSFFIFHKGPVQTFLKWYTEPCKSKLLAITENRTCPHPLLQVIFNFW